MEDNDMQYEIVHLNEKIIVGVGAYTSNQDPNMCEIIGGLWSQFYQNGIHNSIQNRVNTYAIGLYSEYTKEG